MKYAAEEDVYQWSLDELFVKIAELVPEHATHFSNAALQQQFKASTLADDIERFQLYVEAGELSSNLRLVHDKLVDKLLAAHPGILSMAATKYNVQLRYTGDFKAAMQTTRDIVHKLTMDGTLLKRPAPSERTDGGSEVQEWIDVPARKRNKTNKAARDGDRGKSGKGGASGSGSGKNGASSNKAEFSELAKKYGRCFKCGSLVGLDADGRRDYAGHRTECKPDPARFARVMGIVRADLAKGRDPNEELRKKLAASA